MTFLCQTGSPGTLRGYPLPSAPSLLSARFSQSATRDSRTASPALHVEAEMTGGGLARHHIASALRRKRVASAEGCTGWWNATCHSERNQGVQ